MKYNNEYNLWVTETGEIYRHRVNKRKNIDQLVLCKVSQYHGYKNISKSLCPIGKSTRVHRIIWETFKGAIPEGYEIDHINRVRSDNRLENLRVVTRSENHLNKSNNSEFGLKYFEHFGYSETENPNQYSNEYKWFIYHGKCRWEVN